MTAIQTSILPASNTQPKRIKANAPIASAIKVKREQTTSYHKVESFCEMAGWPINQANVHRMAAKLLCMEYKWKNAESLIGGNLGEDWVWVFPEQSPTIHPNAAYADL